MNRKSIFSCLALLLTTSFLASCVSTNQKVVFSSNWQADNTVQQNTLTESLEYEVTFEKATSMQKDYTLDYQNGKYTTTLTTEQLDGRTIYSYETKLTIDVVYTFGQESATFNDVVSSLVKFEKADKALRPISSHKEVFSHSPENGGTALKDCYRFMNYTVDITYNEDYSGETVITAKENEENVESKYSFEMDTKKFTCLDNEQLLFALRGMNPTLSTSAKFNVYSPFVQASQSVKTTFEAEKAIDFSFTKNGVAVKDTIQYYPVSIVLNEKNSGSTQTAWIAKNTNIQSNTYRNVVLKLETPIYYSLGSLVYTLKSANFAN
ncbi:MAG: hypothetical protein E7349_06335 [Clostridiales bacterium]|nr:hypothetical protein [Clostridiales bacterium]